MPIIIFALVLAGIFVLYYFLLNNASSYTTEKPEKKGPFDVIYLPEDLEAEKQKRKQREAAKTESMSQAKMKNPESQDDFKNPEDAESQDAASKEVVGKEEKTDEHTE